ncbi:MAG: host attachment protein [Candidatus Dormibacteraeota bacterium]|nr:host attachment protein [Candidatus Dormibacteraeota bacterium]MBO0762449.1 host attachment protein [Candidatus Dormibacteraeota bacterium]
MNSANKLPGGALVRRLAAVESAPDRGVISLYLDLSTPEQAVPRDRRAQIESLGDRARQWYTDAEQHRRFADQPAVRQDLEGVLEYLEDQFPPRGARGVAVFRCSDPEVFEVVRLASAPPSSVGVDRHPRLLPLLEAGGWLPGTYVLAVSGETAELFAARGLGLQEVARFESEITAHDVEGGEESRHQRHLEEERRAHVRRAAGLLADTARRHRVEQVVLVATPKLVRPLEEAVDPELAGPVAGVVEAELRHRPAAELAPEVEDALASQVQELDRRLHAELQQRMGRGAGARTGVEATLDALSERRVEHLLLAPRLELEGAVCPSCGWLAAGVGSCPVDGASLEAVADLGELMVRRAVEQSAAVRVPADPAIVSDRAAALLRYERQ